MDERQAILAKALEENTEMLAALELDHARMVEASAGSTSRTATALNGGSSGVPSSVLVGSTSWDTG